MNVEGLTNRQLLVKALQQVLRDADNTKLPGFRGGLVPDATLDLARAALGEVVRNKKPESLAKLKPSKKVRTARFFRAFLWSCILFILSIVQH